MKYITIGDMKYSTDYYMIIQNRFLVRLYDCKVLYDLTNTGETK